MQKVLRFASLMIVVGAVLTGCAGQDVETVPKAAEQRSTQDTNRAHQEKIARLRITNPELFREKSPEEKRLQQLEYSYSVNCDQKGWTPALQLKRRFLNSTLSVYNKGNKVKCERLERDLRAAYGLD